MYETRTKGSVQLFCESRCHTSGRSRREESTVGRLRGNLCHRKINWDFIVTLILGLDRVGHDCKSVRLYSSFVSSPK